MASAIPLSAEVSRKHALLWLAGLTVLGLILRLYRLDALPLWNDECIQLNGVMLPSGQLRERHLFGIDHMPPCSYAVQRMFWLPRHSVYAARLPGVLLGAAMVPIAYFFVRRRTDRLGGLVAAALTATSFYLVYYSQELRAYIYQAFGLSIFLGIWIEALAVPLARPVRVWVWCGMVAAGLLCGAFHFAILALLPTIGLVSAAWLAVVAWRQRNRETARRALVRFGLLLLCLSIVFAGVYALMVYSMGPKLQAMSHENRGAFQPPSLTTIRDLLLKFTWGNGWRLIPFLVLIGAGLMRLWGGGSTLAYPALWLFVASFVLGGYVYPRFGQRGLDPESSARYNMWFEWGIRMLATCGVWHLAYMGKRFRTAIVAPSLVGAVVLLQAPLLYHYYRMDCKYNPVRSFQETVESRREPTLLVVGSVWDTHNLQFYWPTNATILVPPTTDAPRVRRWLVDVAAQLPTAVVKPSPHHGTYDSAEVQDCLKRVYRKRDVLRPNRHAAWLETVGVKPLACVDIILCYNETEDIARLPHTRTHALAWLSAEMPCVTTLQPDGAYRLWRVLQREGRLAIVVPAGLSTARVRLPVAQLAARAALEVIGEASPAVCRIEPAASMVLDPSASKWVNATLSLQQLFQLQAQLPVRVATTFVEIDVPSAGAGIKQVILRPHGAPVLMGVPELVPPEGAKAAAAPSQSGMAGMASGSAK